MVILLSFFKKHISNIYTQSCRDFLGQIISFFKTGSHIYFSRDDIYFVIKVGCGLGGMLGSGLWLLARVEFYFKNKK
ncbi:hypothetical protein DPD67_24505 [Salmonella enterica subsp. enterica serovar Javiana]|nr:hypothetical protein [Salmonella enterica subsp. enterica serovar Javiana]